jgi:hypothetical protein
MALTTILQERLVVSSEWLVGFSVQPGASIALRSKSFFDNY